MMGETSLEVFTSVFKVTEKKVKNLSFSTVWFDEVTTVNEKRYTTPTNNVKAVVEEKYL